MPAQSRTNRSKLLQVPCIPLQTLQQDGDSHDLPEQSVLADQMSLTSSSASFSNVCPCVLLVCASQESPLPPVSFSSTCQAFFSTETNMVGVPQFGHDSQFLLTVPTSLVVLHVLVSRKICSITFLGLKVKLLQLGVFLLSF